jgi:hypothetical protein
MEWYSGRYLPAESVRAAFKVKDMPRQTGVGAAQPFERSPERRTAVWSFFVAALLMLALAVVTLGYGRKAADFAVPPAQYLIAENPDGFVSEPFTLTKGGIVQVETSAPVDNSWVYLEIQLLNEERETLLAYTNEISYYHGYSGGESWSEGSQHDSSVFKVSTPGTYRIAVGGEGGQGNTSTAPKREIVKVEIYEGVVLQRYFIVLFILFLIFPIFELLRGAQFEAQRKGEDLWESDD